MCTVVSVSQNKNKPTIGVGLVQRRHHHHPIEMNTDAPEGLAVDSVSNGTEKDRLVQNLKFVIVILHKSFALPLTQMINEKVTPKLTKTLLENNRELKQIRTCHSDI